MKCPPFTLKQAAWAMKQVKLPKGLPVNEFRRGLNIEREHKDITGCRLIPTARVAAAHYRERKNYYVLLAKYVER